MDKKIFTFCVLCITILATRASAQTVYTWQLLVEEAKANHPDIISAAESIKQSQATKDITKSGLFPQVDADAGYTSSKSGSAAISDQYSYGASGSQLIFDGLKTVNQVKQAGQNLTAEQYSYFVTSSNVRLRLRDAYIDLLKEQRLLKISEEILERRRQNFDLVTLRYEAGREHKGALLTAKANLAQAEFEVRQARRSIDIAQRRINKELGRAKFSKLQIEGDFQVALPDPQEPDFELLAETTPALKELMARKEAAKYGLGSAKADFFPEIFAGGGIDRSDSSWPPGEESWSAGVTVTLPVFDGGSRRATVKRARSALKQANADERSGRDGVILTLNESWAGLQNAVDNLAVQEQFLESADARAKISEAQYSNGLISFDDWIIIEDTLVRTRKSYLEVQAQAMVAETEWIQAKGGTLENEN